MRHLRAGKRLGVTTSHRKAMMRNLVTALLEHGEIKTTITRAKEMRKYFDKMIGLGKKQDLHSRRQALAFVKSKEAIKKLFDEYGPLYEDRNGGYTRIFRLGQRLGDNAQMALIQMVDIKEGEKPVQKDAPEAIEEIKSELKSEETAEVTAVEVEADVAEVTIDEPKAEKAEEPIVGEPADTPEEPVVAEAPVEVEPAVDEATETKKDSDSKPE
ncbi:MAG: 50S ribosomal protein L17 [Deltaproteobacteria bacterium]|nr:50S ribosomal protein L17 [Deltaproteobacteria bacterium]MBT7714955.1 50S ribosomal protein L17 [Deltaproteobacteria bacterium]